MSDEDRVISKFEFTDAPSVVEQLQGSFRLRLDGGQSENVPQPAKNAIAKPIINSLIQVFDLCFM